MDLLKLFDNAEDTVELPAGHQLFDEGDPGGVMYVVLSGQVQIRVADQIVGECGPGDMVGELALIDDTGRSASAMVTRDCCLAPVNEERFLVMVQRTPHFALHVMKALAQRLRHMNELQSGHVH